MMESFNEDESETNNNNSESETNNNNSESETDDDDGSNDRDTVPTTPTPLNVPILWNDEIQIGKLLGGGSFCTVYDVQSISIKSEYHESCEQIATKNGTGFLFSLWDNDINNNNNNSSTSANSNGNTDKEENPTPKEGGGEESTPPQKEKDEQDQQNQKPQNHHQQQTTLRAKFQKRFQNMQDHKYYYDTIEQTLSTRPDPSRPPRLALKRLRKQIEFYFAGLDQGQVQSAIRDFQREFYILKYLQQQSRSHPSSSTQQQQQQQPHVNVISLYAFGYDKRDDKNNKNKNKKSNTTHEDTSTITFLVVDHLRSTLKSKIQKWRNQRGAGIFETMGFFDSSAKRSWLERIVVLTKISSALAFLHDHRIVHRDLNPNNIGFDSDGIVKVFDFGLARFLPPPPTTNTNDHDEQSTTKNTTNTNNAYDEFRMTGNTGTLRYMAPELYFGNQPNRTYGVQSDIYSLSMTFYEVLALWEPFVDIKGGGESAFIQYVHVDEQRPTSMDSSFWPPQISQLIREMWNPDPRRRPTASAITIQLEQLLRGPDEDLFPPVGISRFFGGGGGGTTK